jgi:hypothetical protein
MTLLMALMVLVSGWVCGIEISGDIYVSTVRMTEANALVDLYNDVNAGTIPHLRYGLGAEVQARIPARLPFATWLSPSVGLRLLGARSSDERETVRAATVGCLGGGICEFGPLWAHIAVGFSRSTFSFPVAHYERLSGWSLGLSASAGYEWSVLSRLSLEVGMRASWSPVLRLTDREGGVYRARNGPFLDFSGFGLFLGVSWRNKEEPDA